jgi:ketosteroid isomerase-like protein
MDEGRDLEELERSARAAHRRFVEAIRGGDWAAASSGYAVDARLLAPSADVVEGRDGIEAFWRAGLDAGIRDVDRTPLRIDGHGSVAYEIGHYAIRLRPAGGGCVVDRGTYLVVHERDADGAWAWALEMFTPDGEPQVVSGVRPAGQEVGERD